MSFFAITVDKRVEQATAIVEISVLLQHNFSKHNLSWFDYRII